MRRGVGPWEDIRNRLLRRGIQAVCGAPDFVSTSAAADISLLSGGLRFAFVRALGALGVESFVARSGLGYDFLCHTGDLSEYPFYHRRAFEKELAICVGWLDQEDAPIVYDLGANVGFVSTHLAQMLADRSPTIYAFEPAPETYRRLVASVERLGLTGRVQPFLAAATDRRGKVRIAYEKGNSLHTRVLSDGADDASAGSAIWAAGVTLDEFSASRGAPPALIKMDIEGSEVAALRGAAALLSQRDPPAILFEHNPVSLAQCGVGIAALYQLLADYTFYYIDDLRGQIAPMGSPVVSFGRIDWICNIFAAPRGAASAARWAAALRHAQQRLAARERRRTHRMEWRNAAAE
ncbi:MAG TPA: FkbM family methyltransferase [Roseiarcus sp.]|nr:FkbM family methyltransferase [Roseiarcus sp.]